MSSLVHSGPQEAVVPTAQAEKSDAHTPGPWAWMGNRHGLYLATTHSGRRYVMGFRRMGFNGAQPSFRDGNRIVPAADLVLFEVGDRGVRGFEQGKADESVYRYDVIGIDNADARLIAAAPELLDACEAYAATFGKTRLVDQYLADRPDSPLAKCLAAIAKATGEAS